MTYNLYVGLYYNVSLVLYSMVYSVYERNLSIPANIIIYQSNSFRYDLVFLYLRNEAD